MRCISCDKILRDHETRRRGAVTGEYVQLCDGCFGTICDEVADVDDLGVATLPEEEDEVAGFAAARDYAGYL